MNNKQLVDLSVEEMLTVSGGTDDRVHCFILGAVFAGGLLLGPGGWVTASLWAADSAYRDGCLN